MNRCQYCKYRVTDFGELCSKGYESKFKDNGIECKGYKEKVCVCEVCKKTLGVTKSYSDYYCSKECDEKGTEAYEKERKKALDKKHKLEVELEEAHRELEQLNELIDIKILLEKSIIDVKSLTDKENDLLKKYTKALNKRGYAMDGMAYLNCYYGI